MSMVRFRVAGMGAAKHLDAALRGPDRVLEAASASMQEEVLNLISDGFSAGRDPYGAPWDAPNDLQITGRLRSYARGGTNAKGFDVYSTDQKALWHHAPRPRPAWGGKALPTRLQVPTQARGIPPSWSDRMVEAAEEAVEQLMRKAVT